LRTKSIDPEQCPYTLTGVSGGPVLYDEVLTSLFAQLREPLSLFLNSQPFTCQHMLSSSPSRTLNNVLSSVCTCCRTLQQAVTGVPKATKDRPNFCFMYSEISGSILKSAADVEVQKSTLETVGHFIIFKFRKKGKHTCMHRPDHVNPTHEPQAQCGQGQASTKAEDKKDESASTNQDATTEESTTTKGICRLVFSLLHFLLYHYVVLVHSHFHITKSFPPHAYSTSEVLILKPNSIRSTNIDICRRTYDKARNGDVHPVNAFVVFNSSLGSLAEASSIQLHYRSSCTSKCVYSCALEGAGRCLNRI
jgi:hypothetical protein